MQSHTSSAAKVRFTSHTKWNGGSYPVSNFRVSANPTCDRMPRGLGSRTFLFWNLRAALARFRQTNCDGLLATLDRLPTASTFKRSTLALMHRFFDFLLSAFTILCHDSFFCG